jgi:hypothetical protein
MTTTTEDATRVADAVRTKLPAQWAQWRGGWSGEVEVALIDAVLSIRSRYGKRPDSGVRSSVRRYRDDRATGENLDDLTVLAAYEPDKLAVVLKNRQKTGGVLKSQAIVNAAAALVAVGVRHASDLDPTSLVHRSAYRSVKGLGPVTWTYFTMLLGQPGVKADTWIVRFVRDALGPTTSPAEAEQLVTAAATILDVNPTHLDHAIWRHVSGQHSAT